MQAFAEKESEKCKQDGLTWQLSGETVNTYNYESLLSQTLQYTYYRRADGDYGALVQVHGGCDVRGGYTRPRAFRVWEDSALWQDTRVTVYCSECRAYWDLNGSYCDVNEEPVEVPIPADTEPAIPGMPERP